MREKDNIGELDNSLVLMSPTYMLLTMMSDDDIFSGVILSLGQIKVSPLHRLTLS